jgi:hypothetical protein
MAAGCLCGRGCGGGCIRRVKKAVRAEAYPPNQRKNVGEVASKQKRGWLR